MSFYFPKDLYGFFKDLSFLICGFGWCLTLYKIIRLSVFGLKNEARGHCKLGHTIEVWVLFRRPLLIVS